MDKLISIIMPAYNVEKYIARSLESILKQTYQNFEIIIVNDESSDRTGEIIDEFVRKDSRIKVVHNTSRGVAAARNTGLDNCTGEYIGWVDSDDYISEKMFETMLEAMEANDAPMAVCSYQTVSEADAVATATGTIATAPAPTASDLASTTPAATASDTISEDICAEFSGKTYVLSQEETFETYICDNKSFHIYNSVWSKLVKAELFEGLRFPDGHESEEILLTAKLIERCPKCVFVDIPLYNYVVDRSNSIMNSKTRLSQRRFEDELPLWNKQIEFLFTVDEKWGSLAQYQLYRRELFYYSDFRRLGMKEAAKKLAGIVRADKDIITALYSKSFVSSGDRMRMKLFLKSPGFFSVVFGAYEKVVVPFRARKQG